MLVLSVLIISALATAVASIFLAGAQWLLIITAALISAAFYFSRRSAIRPELLADNDPDGLGATAGANHPIRYLRVSVDHQILLNLSGRHRQYAEGPQTASRDEAAGEHQTAPEIRATVLGTETA